MNLAIINESTVVPSITALVGACNRQLRDNVAPAWDRRGPITRAFDNLTAVPAGWDIVTILDNADQAGALGYHDETPDGRPYGRVFAKTILDNHGTIHDGPNSVSVTLSHELCELFVDPNIQLWADNGGNKEIAVEIGDPVENTCYVVNYHGTAVAVSNFALPAYFDFQDHVGPWDHLGLLHGPQSMLAGGYLIIRTGGTVGQKFARDIEAGVDYPEWKRWGKLAPAARTLARIA